MLTKSPLFQFRYLALVIVIAFALRIAGLNSLPTSLNLDEATNGLDALQLFHLSRFTPFLQNNFGRETLFFYVQTLALQLYGISFFSLRFASTIAGTLTIPLLYLVGQRLQLDNSLLNLACHVSASGPQQRENRLHNKEYSYNITALMAATGLAVSYWHIYFSRLGLRAILLPPLLLGVIWYFWRGWFAPPFEQNRRWRLIVAGFLLGLSFYVYLAARLLPALFIVFVAIELIRNKSIPKKQAILDFFIFGLSAALVVIPLGLYFQQNPQAISSRTQAISILATGDPLNTLAGNLMALLRIHFLGGLWLEQWPALNLLSAVGLLFGLPVCLYHLKKPAALFLLLWWGLGTMPVLLSIQDWTGQTTFLRGIVAWPALFLISAIGLVTLTNMLFKTAGNVVSHRMANVLFSPVTVLWLLLIFGASATAYHYFYTWAATYNKLSDHPYYTARYLNSQTDQLTLTPLSFYAETVTNFLLQARYPTLTNLTPGELQVLLNANQTTTYLLPYKSTAMPTFVALKPAANGQGIAYLLPPLTLSQIEALSTYTGATPPMATVLDSEQEPIARVYLLPADAPFLPLPSLVDTDRQDPLTPIQASFNRDVLLTGYRVEPATIKPGETVSLTFNWQARRPINGDYYLFIHLFNILQEERYGQVNTPLTGILYNAHRWPVGLNVPDTHYFTLPADAPEGVYHFEAGLYHASSQQRLPVTIGENQPAQPDDKVILGKFSVWQRPPAPPQYPLTNLQFGDSIALIGVDLPTASLQPGQILTYALHWQALASIPHSYTVFNHLVDADGNLKAQQDNTPQDGRYPTAWWDRNEIVIDSYNLPLPQELEPGQYTLRVGLYQPDAGRRLLLKNTTRDFVDLPVSITIQK